MAFRRGDRSLHPRRIRQPTWSAALAQAAQELRELHPRWGKDKLTPLLRAAAWPDSISMVGRILAHPRRWGALVEPPAAAPRSPTSQPTYWTSTRP